MPNANVRNLKFLLADSTELGNAQLGEFDSPTGSLTVGKAQWNTQAAPYIGQTVAIKGYWVASEKGTFANDMKLEALNQGGFAAVFRSK